MRKQFKELSPEELTILLSEYRKYKEITSYGWKVPFSIQHFYAKIYRGFYHDEI